MKWEEKKYRKHLDDADCSGIPPIKAASILTLGFSMLDDKMSRSIDSLTSLAYDNYENAGKHGSLSARADAYSMLEIEYIGLSAVLSAIYFPAAGFYRELLTLSKK